MFGKAKKSSTNRFITAAGRANGNLKSAKAFGTSSKDWQGHILSVEIDKLPGKKFPLYLIPEGYKRIEDIPVEKADALHAWIEKAIDREAAA